MSHQCHDPQIGRLIGAYELDLLPRREVEAFEEHLASCSDCVQELYMHSAAVTAMHRQPGAILQRIAREIASAPEPSIGRFERLRRSTADLVGPVFQRPWRWPAAVPAGILTAVLLVTIFIVVDRGGRSDLADVARIEPLPYVPLQTRDAGAYEELESGLKKYRDGDYGAAVRHLERGLGLAGDEEIPDRDLLILYLGVAYVFSQDPEAALVPLEEASGSRLTVVADRAKWYMAQAHLLLGDVTSATPILEELAASSRGYADEARRQLREIRRRAGRER